MLLRTNAPGVMIRYVVVRAERCFSRCVKWPSSCCRPHPAYRIIPLGVTPKTAFFMCRAPGDTKRATVPAWSMKAEHGVFQRCNPVKTVGLAVSASLGIRGRNNLTCGCHDEPNTASMTKAFPLFTHVMG